MASMNFWTNEASDAVVVQAPAFSLTKVMATVVPLLTVVATAATDFFKEERFDAGQVATMAVALIVFLAVVTAADVLARAWSTSAKLQADAVSSTGEVTLFPHAIPAFLDKQGVKDPEISLVGFHSGRYLCVTRGETAGRPVWVKADQIAFEVSA